VSSVLKIENLDKTFGQDQSKVYALKNISLKVKRGEFLLIVGKSGSGKSTLLNMIGLLDKPTAGTVIIDGSETSDLNDDQISLFRNKKLGFIFQFANLLSDITILKNVLLPRQISGSTENALDEVKELLKTVGLEDQMYKKPNQLSGGQAQRAAIARGLSNRPSIILADEPTGNLDSVTADSIVQLMKSMCKKFDQTFIIVTHDEHQFGNVDRIITIKDGEAFENISHKMRDKKV
jgi:lipoprotein-releasing system ATP-binding protein